MWQAAVPRNLCWARASVASLHTVLLCKRGNARTTQRGVPEMRLYKCFESCEYADEEESEQSMQMDMQAALSLG